MRTWVRYSRGRLVYIDRITRAPFVEWATTPEGKIAVEQIGSKIRFSLIGRTHAARRLLWRQLMTVARDEEIVAIVEKEANAYLRRLGELAYADGLPRVGVELHRLVVVPRALLNAAAYGSLATGLIAARAFDRLEHGDILRDFFLRTLTDQLDRAVLAARPSPSHALPAGESWTDVGVNRSFVWRIPLGTTPAWHGHHYLLELTREPVTRRLRKAVVGNVERLEASLPALSRAARADILHRARLPLDLKGRPTNHWSNESMSAHGTKQAGGVQLRPR